MNKLILVIPAALLLSACNQTAPITGTTTQKAEKLAQIIERGGQADCKVTNLADNSTTQIIVSGKKMKIVGSDFGEGKKGTMVNDGSFNYIWSEGEKTGFKTKTVSDTITPTQTSEVKQPEDVSQTAAGFEDETKYKMDCATRTISDSVFTPPVEVKFTDFSEVMKAVPSTPSVPTFKIPTDPNINGE